MTPTDVLFGGLLAVAILAVVAAQQAYTWYQSSLHYEQKWKDRCDAHGHANAQIKALESNNSQLKQELEYWENTWNFTADYLNKGGAVLALNTATSQSKYAAATEEETAPHLGSKENIFLPIPVCSLKIQDAAIEQEPVAILTNMLGDTSGRSFHIVVLRLQDAIAKEILKHLCPPVFVAKIHVDILEERIFNAGKRYKLDIEPVSGKSRGANSLAMDWLLKRAKEEGVKEIFGTLTQSIINEAHRIRLYNFYIRKYGFIYTPENNTITKIID